MNDRNRILLSYVAGLLTMSSVALMGIPGIALMWMHHMFIFGITRSGLLLLLSVPFACLVFGLLLFRRALQRESEQEE